MFHSWKNWRAMRWTAREWIVLLVGAIVLPLAYVGAEADATPPAASAATGEAGSALPTRVNIYETPCEMRARTERGIPAYSVHPGRGLMAYVWAHLDGSTPDAELADFWAALDACDRTAPVARWDFGNRVLVNVEYIGG